MAYIKILVLLIIIKISYGFEANLFLNLSKIEDKSNLTIGTYESHYIGKIFPLHLKLDWNVVLEIFYSEILTERPFFSSQNLVKVNIGDKTWNLKMKFVTKFNKACSNISQISEMKVDNILNESFECKNQVTGYITRFYYTNTGKLFFYDTAYGNQKYFYQEISVHWVIAQNDSLLINNELNYKNFLKNCNSVPYMYYLYVIMCATVILIILLRAAFWVAKMIADLKKKLSRRTLNPIIIVRPAPINVYCH